MTGTVLVVDDQQLAREALAAELVEAGYSVIEAGDGTEGWDYFRRGRPDLVVTDLVMPSSDGLELLRRVRAQSETPVILYTAHPSVGDAVCALKSGADEFVTSTDVDCRRLVSIVRDTLDGGSDGESDELARRFVGGSREIRRLRARVAALAPLSAPVLVSGERGSGRRAVIAALHELGSTAGRRVVRVAAGSFRSRDPIPERGVVILDGVDRLSSEGQAVWAAYLDRGPRAEAGARVLATASERLTARIDQGAFDRRLGRALLRFHVQVPPLRDRSEDIGPLADSLVERFGSELGRRRLRLSAPARRLVASYHWPGNVDQLEQVLERAVAFSKGRGIRHDVVADLLAEVEESIASIRDDHSAEQRERLLRTLRETGGNVTRTAALLGKSRPAIYRLMERYGIPLERRRPDGRGY
ncbi:MAG: response regulator [Myxococcota bacterium]|nr:response regulator [Myxococcota bacterium]